MSTPDHRPVRQEIQQNIKISRLEQGRLHPLVHTVLLKNSIQDVKGGSQRVSFK